ncbi:OmpA family protein [Chitinophaga niabensis]|uniref:Outer membrane protein OmpA n=1 Tax=Chitinophaga niabensis TaxID=536979 RepID=A0A1N6E1H1_9BACT|nr:OmpA family protein [Chitinophaga niabensis]SIN76841.1 Outer membrane protein OmpA [Chitinophaga niabensis]
MIRRSLTFIATITLAGSLQAQEQKSVLRLAEEAYAREEYALAGALYQRQTSGKENKTPVALLMKMAHSYQEIGRFQEAAGYYQQIIARPDHPTAASFAYGETLRQLEQYEAAKQQYALFTTSNADSIQLKEIAIRSCDSAAIWIKAPSPLQLQPLKTLNTSGSDLVSSIVNRKLVLMSNGYRRLVLNGNRETNPATDRRTQQPFYKAYVYQQYAQGNGTMYLEELLPKVFGKYDYHIGPVYLNKSEDTLYATINIQGKNVQYTGKGPVNGVRQLQLYLSVKTNDKWSELVLLPGINIAGYSSSHAVLNTGGNILYFVSDRPGGLGQTDIWYCEKQADGNWSTPLNCGDKINTIAAETFPTVNEEGALYFSSKGHAGFGGYDIYRVKGERTNWGTPENMKAPFNSGADDIGFVLKNNGPEGYLSSNKPGGMGSDDIYSFVATDLFNSINGIKAPDVIRNNEPKDTKPPVTVTGPRKLTAAEEADKQKLEQLKFLYDYNSADLLTESQQMLDNVAEIMARHPDWKLVVLSFADNRGTDQYNNDLSARRCFSSIEYLAQKGIDQKRIYYANKGESEPVNKCKDGVPCNEEEHRQNRRTELQVMW